MSNIVKYIGGGQYVGTDWDYPSAVRSLGYGLRRRGERCNHTGTDGTIDCPDCGKPTSKFIEESGEILYNLAEY